jgi:hypothetical protein
VKALRLLGALAIVAGLVLASSRATASSSEGPSGAPCTSATLTAQLSNVDSVQAFGCEGTWAYLWATVGTGVAQVSVTELMTYAGGTWNAASRSAYCHAGLLPDLIYHRACFSN